MHRINLFTCVKQYKFRPCSFLKQLNIKFIIVLSIEFTVNGFLKHTACSSMGVNFTVIRLNQVCVCMSLWRNWLTVCVVTGGRIVLPVHLCSG